MSDMKTIKTLREMTGCGIMDCKEALIATNNSLEEAVAWLRKKGMAKAAKKADRESNEGVVGLVTDGAWGALLQVASETDFVARNEKFQQFVADLLSLLAKEKPQDLAAFEKLKLSNGKTVTEELTHMVAVIGESLKLKALKVISAPGGFVAAYLHNAYTKNLGKIGVLVALETDNPSACQELGNQLAMHVAANNPIALQRSEVDQAVLDKEKAMFMDEARASGKPEAALEKIVTGKLNKFCSEVVFEEQPFIMDPKKSVRDVLKETSASSTPKIAAFAMLKVG